MTILNDHDKGIPIFFATSQPYLAHRSSRETSELWPGTDEAVAAGFQAPAMQSVNMWLINDS